MEYDEFEKIDNILKVVSVSDFKKGKNYYLPYIDVRNKKLFGDIYKNEFLVESERTSRLYEVSIDTSVLDQNIVSTYCDCMQFENTGSCKHVAACLYNYYDTLFYEVVTDEMIENITTNIFKAFTNIKKEEKNRNVKEEVSMEMHLTSETFDFTQETCLNVALKLGTNKLYNCKDTKLVQFLNAYQKSEEFSFGKSFDYDPKKHYFSQENKEILDYLIDIKNQRNRYYAMSNINLVGDYTIEHFLKIIANKKYHLNGFLIKDKKKTFPVAATLKLEDNKNILKFAIPENIFFITSNLKIVQVDNTLYYLNSSDTSLLYLLINNSLDRLIFDSQKKDIFKDTILPIIKNKIKIDENITDIKITKNIKPKLYFDLYYDKIICNLIFAYDDEDINYFDTKSITVRDADYENKVIDDLYNYGFIINKNKILLENLDSIANFLETDLEKLTKEYETYTSEKIKKINIIKKSNIKSTFSIGKDNIMSYSFDLGDIKENEIVNILESLKNKKKYYRLKSGDIINLERDTDLSELATLTEELDIGKKELESGGGVIPEYRAIYLDSLKDDKYHIIETNNLFDDLINKFKQYKNSDITLSATEFSILRSYQVDGVKWLYNIDKTGFGGILADEMGLGKSIQTIYYIKELLKEKKDYKFLIVSPTSLAYNWKNEFDKFASNMKYKVIVGLRNIRREKLQDIEDINVLITTYSLLREDKEIYQDINFKTIIIDEAQNIKNINTEITKTVKSMNASTKIALTGTPIENSILELWSIFDFIMPGFLSGLQTFEKKYNIKNFDDEGIEKLKQLKKITSPFILRRKKQDVIKDLPEKVENNIYIDLTVEQKKIYLAELEKVNREMDEIMQTVGISKARFLILKLLTKLRQICIDPRLVFEDYTGGSGKLEEFINVVLNKVEDGHKILVFTSFRQALELARKELENRKITSYTIDGTVSSKKRMELVEKFNKNKTNVFFIMLKAGGTGLNLTSADVVIHLDLWWNPQAENQATDRAHRIGQKNVVDVIKFITRGTIEEKILELQQKKKILSDKLIDEDNIGNSFNNLTEQDIKELLSYSNDED